MSDLRSTLGDRAWMQADRDGLRALLPETWTLMANLKILQIGYGLKLLDVDWRSEDELAKIMVFLEKAGLMLRDGNLVRRSTS